MKNIFALILLLLAYSQNVFCISSGLNDDLPFIACEVCRYAVNELVSKINEERLLHPKHKLDETRIAELIEGLCESEAADSWIRKLDIVSNSNGEVTLVGPGGIAKCNEECSSISRSCTHLLDNEIDPDDISSLFWKLAGSLTVSEAQERICTKMSKRCARATKKSIKKRFDYVFTPLTEKELQMEKLMAQMKEMGMSGNMKSRDEMMMDMLNSGEMDDMIEDEPLDEYNDPEDDSPSSGLHPKGGNIEF
eukprot:gene4430-6265_t